MAEEELGTEIVNAVLVWMGKQKLESVAVLGRLRSFRPRPKVSVFQPETRCPDKS